MMYTIPLDQNWCTVFEFPCSLFFTFIQIQAFYAA